MFGCGPLILAAKRLLRATDHRSKTTMPEETIQKPLIMMHDRVVLISDKKARKHSKDENQFESPLSLERG